MCKCIHVYIAEWHNVRILSTSSSYVLLPLVTPMTADFITFIAMCLKTFRIFRGAGVALNLTVGDDWDGTLKGYWRARYVCMYHTMDVSNGRA